jgi:2,3,4,5-tetrahydropyridine-2-carboxylate N-succinyltransferase
MLNNKKKSDLTTPELVSIQLIEQAYEQRDVLNNPNNVDLKLSLQKIIKDVLTKLEDGILRVAEKHNNEWHTNSWIKKAILLSFIINDNQLIKGSTRNYFDKLPPRLFNADLSTMQSLGSRIIPPACIRKGAYIGKNTVIMPSYINVGAFVDEGTMIDIWSTIGSCAQIGKNVHIAAGAGIGGVLEPMRDNPTIIEDNCFIGAGSQIVEGVVVENNSVIGTGVYISTSTKIYDRETDLVSYGKIPSGSVVVSGNLPSDNKKYSLYCAVIVKKVDLKTLDKIKINSILREL